MVLTIVGGLSGLTSPGVTAAPAPPSGRPTECRFEAEFTIAPGLGLVPSSGTFTSGGERGRLACDGPVAGRAPAGAGTFGAGGRYGVDGPDGCLTGDGHVLQSFTLPTAEGPYHFTNDARFTWRPEPRRSGNPAAPFALATGRFDGPRMSGTLEIVPVEGDCVSAPATRVLVRLRGTPGGVRHRPEPSQNPQKARN